MKSANYISNIEHKFLTIAFSAILLFTIGGISSKFISTYNFAVEKEQGNQFNLTTTQLTFFEVSDCFPNYSQTANFTLFSLFIFTISFAFWYFLNTKFLAAISAVFLALWICNSLFLHNLFIYLTDIEWNSKMIRLNIFDLLLWILFPIILLVQAKIILRFAKEKFHSKYSLK